LKALFTQANSSYNSITHYALP